VTRARKRPAQICRRDAFLTASPVPPHRSLADARRYAYNNRHRCLLSGSRVHTRKSSDTAQFSPLAHRWATTTRTQSAAFVEPVSVIFQMFRCRKNGEAGCVASGTGIITRSILEHPFHLSRLDGREPRGQWRDASCLRAICPTRCAPGHRLLASSSYSKGLTFGHRNRTHRDARKLFCRFWRRGGVDLASPDTATPTNVPICRQPLHMCPRPSIATNIINDGADVCLLLTQTPAWREAHQARFCRGGSSGTNFLRHANHPAMYLSLKRSGIAVIDVLTINETTFVGQRGRRAGHVHNSESRSVSGSRMRRSSGGCRHFGQANRLTCQDNAMNEERI